MLTNKAEKNDLPCNVSGLSGKVDLFYHDSLKSYNGSRFDFSFLLSWDGWLGGGGGGGGVGGSWGGFKLPDHAVATTDVRTKNKVLNTAERISKNHLLMNTMGSIQVSQHNRTFNVGFVQDCLCSVYTVQHVHTHRILLRYLIALSPYKYKPTFTIRTKLLVFVLVLI